MFARACVHLIIYRRTAEVRIGMPKLVAKFATNGFWRQISLIC